MGPSLGTLQAFLCLANRKQPPAPAVSFPGGGPAIVILCLISAQTTRYALLNLLSITHVLPWVDPNHAV